jgi:lambda repressor-like predicted transcriptional regulator
MQWQRIRQRLERESLKRAKEAERESQEWEFWKHAAESDFWRHFQGKFEALADEERTVVLKTHPDRGLRAYCVYNSDRTTAEAESIRQGVLCLLYRFESGKWSLSDGPNENFKARYEALATRAGIRLCPPRGARPLDFWLHSLCIQLRRTDSPTLFARSDTGGIITSVCESSATFSCWLERNALETSSLEENTSPTNQRESFVLPFLDRKGWSILDWATNSGVDFNTASNYLKGKTVPYKSTLKKLADALGVDVQKLPS